MRGNDITQETLEQIRQGNERALLMLYKKYHKQIFQFINRQIRDVGISEELVQDVFLGCIDGIREGHKIDSFSAYLFTIARYKTIDHIRRKKIKKVMISTLPESIVNGAATLLFNEKVQKDEVADVVERILKHLPHEYALIIRLKYIDGFPVKKIADKLAVNFKAAESMLFRARREFSKLYSALNS
ncbi:MAG: RNA polymerase sigma factor [Candidatus Roizmanbacteria bacterium]|nr:RNA polymerase sigma factor [Candidatus Roizmanbacteria bacterium]